LDLNEVGLAVGIYHPPGGFHENHAVLWRDGDFIALTDRAGPQSYVNAVNNAGVVVGMLGDEFGSEPVRWDEEGDGWTMTRLGADLSGSARDVNDRGQIVGILYEWPTPETKVSIAFLWRDGELIRLPDFGIGGLNNAGWLVGSVRVPSQEAPGEDEEAVGRAALWIDGEVTELGTLGGASSGAADVNDNGEIVGTSDTADGERHVFVWEDGVMRDLNELVPAELGITLQRPLAISNEGVILCRTEEGYWTGNLVMLIPLSAE
jgi:probable HAF family extracellular repeat protein